MYVRGFVCVTHKQFTEPVQWIEETGVRGVDSRQSKGQKQYHHSTSCLPEYWPFYAVQRGPPSTLTLIGPSARILKVWLGLRGTKTEMDKVRRVPDLDRYVPGSIPWGPLVSSVPRVWVVLVESIWVSPSLLLTPWYCGVQRVTKSDV